MYIHDICIYIISDKKFVFVRQTNINYVSGPAGPRPLERARLAQVLPEMKKVEMPKTPIDNERNTQHNSACFLKRTNK